MISRVKDRHRYRSIFFSDQNTHKIKTRTSLYVVKAPEAIRLGEESERKLLFKLVCRMYKKAKKGFNICIDFTNTCSIFAHGMLYLFAEISNIYNLYRNVRITCRTSRTIKVNHVLYQIGLFKLCGHRYLPQNEYDDVVHWRSAHGVHVIGKIFDSIIDPDTYLPELPANLDLFGACVEATKNAHIHAYSDVRQLSKVAFEKTSWWIFSQIKDKSVTVAICDLGVGIPKTLPKTNRKLVATVIKFFGGKIDARLIEAAINAPSSRTGMTHRGNGLKKIAKIAADDSRATLLIHSGRGCVQIIKGKRIVKNYKREFPGTLVAWKIPLEKTNGDDQYS